MKKYPILLAVFAVAALVGWFISRQASRNASVVVNTTDSTNQIQATERQLETNRQLQQLASARDDRRLLDIRALQSNLLVYFTDHNNAFPDTLSMLVPNYMASVPVDPQTGTPYPYAPQADGALYTIQYQLEIGTQGISAGQHLATPNGIATP